MGEGALREDLAGTLVRVRPVVEYAPGLAMRRASRFYSAPGVWLCEEREGAP